jgi:hypothetical protein
MKIYAELAGLRARQLLSDALLVLWVVVWVRVGMRVHDLVDKLAGPGERMESAGRSFSGSVDRLGRRADDLPLIGDRLQRSFETVADGGRSLQEAGSTQQAVVHDLALWLGVIVAVLPILWALARYVPGRIAWIREASAAHVLRSDDRLFALRALTNRSLAELARASNDPVRAYETGDHRALAALELRTLGLLP